MLAALVLVPALGGAALLLVPSDRTGARRAVAVGTTGISLVLAAVVLLALRLGEDGEAYRFVVRAIWLPSARAEFFCGVDGARGLLIFLTAFLTLGAALAGREECRAELLLLQATLTGVLVSLDLLLLASFWTLSLLAAGLLRSRRDPREARAAARHLTATLAGAAVMLVGLLMVRERAGTLDLTVLDAGESFLEAPGRGRFAGLLLLLGFAVPLLAIPRGRGSASVLVLGALTKVGAFGILRVALPLAPGASADMTPAFVGLGALALLTAGVIAVRATDPARLAAASHLGFTGLVLYAVGALAAGAGPAVAAGALVLLVVHGFLVGLLLLVTGCDLDGGRRLRILSLIALVGLAVLPVIALFAGGPSAVLGVVADHPLAAVPGMLGVGLVAIGLVRGAGFRWRETRGVLGPALGTAETLALGALAATALVIGLVPFPTAELVIDAAERIVAALAAGATP